MANKTTVSLSAIAAFLDRELSIAGFSDASNNGLQVENSGWVGHVCCAVDASMESFEEAARRGADLLICHHGLSWDDSLKQVTGLNYKRLSFLIRHDIALYASHLPLDAHPRLGNNAQICRAIGIVQKKPFGVYNGREIGFQGRLRNPMRYSKFKDKVARVMRSDLRTMDFGGDTVRTVAVVSGGAAEEIEEAGQKGVDVYLSGEPKLMAYALAQEYAINAVFAGHYATETFGVRALAELLRKAFGLRAEFLDLRIPF
jgi:dinuclear metal center YbgI/SA1388 family protein